MLNEIKYIFTKGIKYILLQPTFKDCIVDTTAKANLNSLLVNIKLSRYSYIGYNCMVTNTIIGSFCSISNNCVIGAPGHPIDWVSSSPVFVRGRNFLRKNFSKHNFISNKSTVIGNDVWIGSNCIIRDGVKINDGAIIGMGSIVTKDIPSYEIWGGNPAKLIKKRFDDKVIEKLLRTKWWEWSDEKIEKEAILFNNINLFIANMIDESATQQ